MLGCPTRKVVAGPSEIFPRIPYNDCNRDILSALSAPIEIFLGAQGCSRSIKIDVRGWLTLIWAAPGCDTNLRFPPRQGSRTKTVCAHMRHYDNR